MKIAFVNCTADTFTPTKSGAIGTWIWELCQVAARRGSQPVVVSREADVPSYRWGNTLLVRYPDVRPFRGAGRLFAAAQRISGWGHPRQRSYAVRVAEAIRKAGICDWTFILSNDIELSVFLREQFPKARIIHNAHNNNPAHSRFRHRFASSINVATAVTGFCAKWNADYYGCRVETLYNGVDAERFRPGPATRPEGPVINFVGRVDHSKGTDLLADAALLLCDRTKAFALQILGSNYYDRYVHDVYQVRLHEKIDRLRRLGIPVSSPGWIARESLPDELRRAQINCVPARWDEPFGLATLEGMACGLATVASRTGGTPEVVGDAGWLFERGDVSGLASLLENLVCDPDVRDQQGILARERAMKFTWEATWVRLMELCSA